MSVNAVSYTHLYKIVYQVEIDNLKHIIEGLRYGEAPSQIEAMLIY